MYSEAKSLIKHLLTADVSKRYGCLKNGVKDVIDHRFFKEFDWKGLLFMTLDAPYIPKVK
jgi:protein kinase A/protein kinase X